MNIDQNAPVITRDEIIITAPLGAVWNLFTDISSWTNWNKDIKAARLDVPLAVGAVFHWSTGGLNIASTIGELIPQQLIGWSGTVQGIEGIHIWRFNSVADGVQVGTEESWNGEPVRKQISVMQQALDQSIRIWVKSLKREAEAHTYK